MLVDRMRQENKPLLKYFNKVSDLNLLLHYQRVFLLSGGAEEKGNAINANLADERDNT